MYFIIKKILKCVFTHPNIYYRTFLSDPERGQNLTGESREFALVVESVRKLKISTVVDWITNS